MGWEREEVRERVQVERERVQVERERLRVGDGGERE